MSSHTSSFEVTPDNKRRRLLDTQAITINVSDEPGPGAKERMAVLAHNKAGSHYAKEFDDNMIKAARSIKFALNFLTVIEDIRRVRFIYEDIVEHLKAPPSPAPLPTAEAYFHNRAHLERCALEFYEKDLIARMQEKQKAAVATATRENENQSEATPDAEAFEGQ